MVSHDTLFGSHVRALSNFTVPTNAQHCYNIKLTLYSFNINLQYVSTHYRTSSRRTSICTKRNKSYKLRLSSLKMTQRGWNMLEVTVNLLVYGLLLQQRAFFGNIYDKKAHKLFDNMAKLTHWNDKGIKNRVNGKNTCYLQSRTFCRPVSHPSIQILPYTKVYFARWLIHVWNTDPHMKGCVREQGAEEGIWAWESETNMRI